MPAARLMNRCASFANIVKSKKVSALGEDGCDKLLQAASDRWERGGYGNIYRMM